MKSTVNSAIFNSLLTSIQAKQNYIYYIGLIIIIQSSRRKQEKRNKKVEIFLKRQKVI
jgi:hypothetical protein